MVHIDIHRRTSPWSKTILRIEADNQAQLNKKLAKLYREERFLVQTSTISDTFTDWKLCGELT